MLYRSSRTRKSHTICGKRKIAFPKIFPNVPKRSQFFPKTFQLFWDVFFMCNFVVRKAGQLDPKERFLVIKKNKTMSKKKSKQASAAKVLSSTLMQMANWLRYKEGWLPDAATRQAWLCQHALERLGEGGFRSFNAARLDDYLKVES